jgi:hypothetical protein
MKSLTLFLYFLVLLICASCITTGKLYTGEHKVQTGFLNNADFEALAQMLSRYTGTAPADTILIKYDYNNESCWDLLDQKDENHIRGFINRNNSRILNVSASRKNVSAFQFREPGKNLNKLKSWNNSIIVDSSKQLYQLLFKKRATCGSSIAVLPDKRYVLIRSDSHSAVFDLTHEKIAGYLSNKQ